MRQNFSSYQHLFHHVWQFAWLSVLIQWSTEMHTLGMVLDTCLYVTQFWKTLHIPYSGKVWQGESLTNLVNHPWFTKLKPSKFLLTIITFWLNLFIRQTFFRQLLETSEFAKLYPRQAFPLYSTHITGFREIQIWNVKCVIDFFCLIVAT